MMDSEEVEPSFGQRVASQLGRKYQHYLDQSTLYHRTRWVLFAALLVGYCVRVFFLNGWYIVSYSLGIYLLNLFIGFLSPPMDPETDGPVLPSNMGGEHKPFIRRVPEFKFWYSSSRAIAISFCCTFFKVFDVPVFWPILLIYFCTLFFVTMKRQILHMIKHRYVPWSSGKQKYKSKDALDMPGGPGGPPKRKVAD